MNPKDAALGVFAGVLITLGFISPLLKEQIKSQSVAALTACTPTQETPPIAYPLCDANDCINKYGINTCKFTCQL